MRLSLDLSLSSVLMNKGGGPPFGPELVTNGDFSDGTNGWTGQFNATIAAVNGECRITATQTGTQRFSRPVSLVVGKTYRLAGRARRGTTSGTLLISVSTAANLSAAMNTPGVTSTTMTAVETTFVATATTMYVGGNDSSANTVGATSFFDDISIREVLHP